METNDARRLSPQAQEDLRRRGVRAVVDRGMTQVEAVDTFGVDRTSVHQWVKAYRQRGAKALSSKRRGRPKHSRLAGWQAATVVNLVTDRCPDQLRLPFALWTRQAVGQLMARRVGSYS